MDTAKQKLTDKTPGSNTEQHTRWEIIKIKQEVIYTDFRLSSTLGLRISRRTKHSESNVRT